MNASSGKHGLIKVNTYPDLYDSILSPHGTILPAL